MTPKDRADLEAALVTGIDWIALSFVQRAEDVARGQETDPRPRRCDGQDRKAAGDRRGSTKSSRPPTR